MHLPVAKTWAGEALAADQIASVELRLVPGRLEIDVDAPFHGDPPPDAPSGATPGLWAHEVVEIFLLGAGQRYTEIELGPHGHHLVLQLEGPRNRVAQELPLVHAPRIEGARWRTRAHLDVALLPPDLQAVNAYAIWGPASSRQYCAHAPVPGEAPDFHRLDAFVPWAP